MKHAAVSSALCLALFACAADGEDTYFEPPDPSEGFQVGMTVTAAPGEEIWKCLVMEALPFDERIAYISHGVHKQTPFVHHMDLMALALTGVDIEPGVYDCDDIYQGADSERIMDDGLILYASQAAEDSVVLPDGVVAEVPTATPFMYEVHYINTTDEEVQVDSYLNAYVADISEVQETIWGGPVRDRNINVPGDGTDHVEWSRCVMDKAIDLIFLSSHTHELAYDFQVRTFDGENVGDEVIYSNSDWQNPYLQHFDPPLHLEAGEGLEFSCFYRSNKGESTTWGFSAAEEMCQIGIVFTPGPSGAECNVVETSDGVIVE